MEQDDKKAGSASEARKNETSAGERTLTQDTGPKNQDDLKGDDTVDDTVNRLEGAEVEEAATEYNAGSDKDKGGE